MAGVLDGDADRDMMGDGRMIRPMRQETKIKRILKGNVGLHRGDMYDDAREWLSQV